MNDDAMCEREATGERDHGEELWFDVDAELLEKLASEADYEDESIAEFVERACREKAQ